MDTVRVKGKEHTREEEFVSVAQVIAGPVIAIKAMVCRRWDSTNAFGKYLSTEYLLSDAEGNMIHCTSRSNNSHRVITLVEEGSVYSFKNFKDKFRNHKDDLHILSLKGYIVVNRLSCPTDGFIRFPFHSTELEKIEPNGSAYLIDVIGIVINMGKIRSTKVIVLGLLFASSTFAFHFKPGVLRSTHILQHYGRRKVPWSIFY